MDKLIYKVYNEFRFKIYYIILYQWVYQIIKNYDVCPIILSKYIMDLNLLAIEYIYCAF